MARSSKSGKADPSKELWINPKSSFGGKPGVSEWEGYVAVPGDSRRMQFADLALGLKKPGIKRDRRAGGGGTRDSAAGAKPRSK